MADNTAHAGSSASSLSSSQASDQHGAQTAGQGAGAAATLPGLPRLPPTPFQPTLPLMTMNALVGFSQVPGNLDYNGYVRYLTQLGHIRRPTNTPQGLAIPVQPVNSSALQSLRGDRTDGLTDYRPDQACWSQDNMPDIIYIFDKPANWLGKADLNEPPRKAYPVWGKLLRDIPILPDHISPDLEGWRYEVWHRMDPRIKKEDIQDRMPPAALGQHNAKWSMRVQRFRENANVLGWVAKGGKFAGEKQRLTQLLLAAGVPLASNTTRGITWGRVPSGQRIQVPAKLRWESCVEPAPAQAPVAGVVSLPVNILPSAAAPINTPVSLVTGPITNNTPPVTNTTSTVPPGHAANIPVTQAPSAHGIQNSAAKIIIPPLPSRAEPQRHITSNIFQHFAANSVPENPILNHLLDPQISQNYPSTQVSATGNMNPPSSQPSRPNSLANRDTRVPVADSVAEVQLQISSAFGDIQATSSRLRRPQLAPGSSQGVAGFSSTYPATIPPDNLLKRKRDNNNEEESPLSVTMSAERPVKKPRSARVPAATVASTEPRPKFRKRFPRAAFDGNSKDMPQSLHQQFAASDGPLAAGQASFAGDEQIQLARPSLGYQDTHVFIHEGRGDVVAAPEDFLHPDGVDAGRLSRLGRCVHGPSHDNADGLL